MEVTDQIHALAALAPGGHLLHPLGTRLGGFQILYEQGGKGNDKAVPVLN
jgi:hypothetical protein